MIGFVNLFKAAGPSSARAVARVRRIYTLYASDRHLAAGHMGTLDPQAAGVLPIAIGKATRLIPLISDQRKSYACTLVLGRSTTTQDAQGETVDCAAVPKDWPARLEATLPSFVGRIDDYDDVVLPERPIYVPHGYAQRLRQLPDGFDSQGYIFDVADTLIGHVKKHNVRFHESLP